MRGATNGICKKPLITGVSIHAPVRGATHDSFSDLAVRLSFNPRAREGRDKYLGQVSCDGKDVSIHAPVRGATDELLKEDLEYIVSIHAPVRGATKRVFCYS